MLVQLYRKNYGGRLPADKFTPTNDLLVALDLLYPSDRKGHERDSVTRTLFDRPSPFIEHKKGDKRERTYVTKHVLEWVKENAVHSRNIENGEYQVGGRACEFWHKFLDAHDRVHIGDTLEVRPGIYEHFKKERDGELMLYCVQGVSENTETGELVVSYQSTYGEKALAMAHRNRDMFAEIIWRPKEKYFGPRFTLLEEFDRPCHIWSKEELAAALT